MGKSKNKGIAAAKREKKRLEAEQRQRHYDNLSPAEKIRRLDERLGKGVGAKKERSKIMQKWIKM